MTTDFDTRRQALCYARCVGPRYAAMHRVVRATTPSGRLVWVLQLKAKSQGRTQT